MFELAGISIFGIASALLSGIHFALRKFFLKNESVRFVESALIVAFALSSIVLYALSPFIHLFTVSLTKDVEQYFVPILCFHLALIFFAVFMLLLSLTPLYKRFVLQSSLVARNWYALATAVCLVSFINLSIDIGLHDQSIDRQYDFQVRKGISDYELKNKFLDLNSDLVLLESWIRSSIWTPWILFVILGSSNFRGMLKAAQEV